MADEEEERESKEEPSPSPHISPKQDSIHNRSFSDSYTNQNNVVFPPINHEDLHNKPPSPLPELEISYPLSPPHRGGADGCDVARRWVEQLGIRVVSVVSWVRNYWVLRGANWSLSRCAGMAVLVWWVWVAMRWRRKRLRVREESRDHLVLVIKEKDEKIKQLLHQIAQMNQLFLSLRKSSSPGGQIT